MTLNGVMAITLCYFTEFGKSVPAVSMCTWPNLCTSILYFVVRVVNFLYDDIVVVVKKVHVHVRYLNS